MRKIALYAPALLAGSPAPGEALARAGSLGFDGIELDARRAGDADALGAEAAGAGLGISALAADLRGRYPFQDDRDAYLAEFDRNLGVARNLGVRTVAVGSGETAGHGRQSLARAIDTWKTCAIRAAEAEMRLVWEFGPGPAFASPAEVAAIAEGVDEPNFGVLFDAAKARSVSDAAGLLDRLAGLVGAIRVEDPADRLLPALLEEGRNLEWIALRADSWEAADRGRKALADCLANYYP